MAKDKELSPEEQAALDTQNAANPKGDKAGKLKTADKPEEGTVVGLQKADWNGKDQGNYMWIEGTGKSKHLPKGQKHEVHIVSGEKLISKGAAIKSSAPVKAKAVVKKKSTDEDDD